MKKEYSSPDFELTRFDFESILEEGGHGIVHSKGEVGEGDGNEGFD
ncbi:MAG: hypothetical protein IIY61_02585 [Ruminococcus sp.]|nr:hypothetical protein [Ruminococcus sp.]